MYQLSLRDYATRAAVDGNIAQLQQVTHPFDIYGASELNLIHSRIPNFLIASTWHFSSLSLVSIRPSTFMPCRSR